MSQNNQSQTLSPAELKAQQEQQILIREQRRQELEQTAFSTNAQGGALMQPRNGKELMDMANLMSGSGNMVRDFYRGNPGDCAALIMICQPYGFNPFMVSWKTYKASKTADAPISFEGQLVNAMVNQSAPITGRLKYSYEGNGDDRICKVWGHDRDTGEEISYTSPAIKDINVKNSPLWKSDPDQQLGYFSARAWARRHFPELLLGVYTREEIEEAPRAPRDITPDKPKPGGFADRAQAARAPRTEQEPLEGEILPADEEQAPVEQEGQRGGGTTEQTEAYSAGAAAYHDGFAMSDCPHQEGPECSDWQRGWHEAYELKQDEGHQ